MKWAFTGQIADQSSAQNQIQFIKDTSVLIVDVFNRERLMLKVSIQIGFQSLNRSFYRFYISLPIFWVGGRFFGFLNGRNIRAFFGFKTEP